MSVPGERVSDADRDRVLETLTRHMVAGTLTADELAARTDEAYAARTAAELERVTRELPALTQPPLLVRAADRIPLRVHVGVYVAVSALLIGAWAAGRLLDPTSAEAGFVLLWPFWIMLAWGVLLIAHALYALRRPAFDRPGRTPGR